MTVINLKPDLGCQILDTEIFDNLSTGVLALDSTLHVIWINSACESLLHISRERSLGIEAQKIIVVKDDLAKILEQVRDLALPIAKRGTSLTLPVGETLQVDLIVTPRSYRFSWG